MAIFLVDMLAHCCLREGAGLISAIRQSLSVNHPIRRLLLPFTLGTVYRNRVYNEYLRENGLYHRVFAFKYKELQRLIRDSMENPPTLQRGQIRQPSDQMKYRFRLFRKKLAVMKRLPDEIYPLYTDSFAFWSQTLDFVQGYIEVYYNDQANDDSLLCRDKELVSFYQGILHILGINSKYRLKKFKNFKK